MHEPDWPSEQLTEGSYVLAEGPGPQSAPASLVTQVPRHSASQHCCQSCSLHQKQQSAGNWVAVIIQQAMKQTAVQSRRYGHGPYAFCLCSCALQKPASTAGTSAPCNRCYQSGKRGKHPEASHTDHHVPFSQVSRSEESGMPVTLPGRAETHSSVITK